MCNVYASACVIAGATISKLRSTNVQTGDTDIYHDLNDDGVEIAELEIGGIIEGIGLYGESGDIPDSWVDLPVKPEVGIPLLQLPQVSRGSGDFVFVNRMKIDVELWVKPYTVFHPLLGLMSRFFQWDQCYSIDTHDLV